MPGTADWLRGGHLQQAGVGRERAELGRVAWGVHARAPATGSGMREKLGGTRGLAGPALPLPVSGSHRMWKTLVSNTASQIGVFVKVGGWTTLH